MSGQSVLDCVEGAATEAARAACLPADDFFDSVLALDMRTGAIRWATRAISYDAWTVDCIPFFGDGDLCPDPAGPDFDFGQAPALFTVKDGQDVRLGPTTDAGLPIYTVVNDTMLKEMIVSDWSPESVW